MFARIAQGFAALSIGAIGAVFVASAIFGKDNGTFAAIGALMLLGSGFMAAVALGVGVQRGVAAAGRELGFTVVDRAPSVDGVIDGLRVRLYGSSTGSSEIEVDGMPGPEGLLQASLPGTSLVDQGVFRIRDLASPFTRSNGAELAAVARAAAKIVLNAQLALVAAARDPDAGRRRDAVRAIGRLRALAPATHDALQTALGDESPTVRIAAFAAAVAHRGSPGAPVEESVLVTISADESAEMETRREVILALRMLGTETSVPVLRRIEAPPELADQARGAAVAIEGRASAEGRLSVTEVSDAQGALSTPPAIGALTKTERN